MKKKWKNGKKKTTNKQTNKKTKYNSSISAACKNVKFVFL